MKRSNKREDILLAAASLMSVKGFNGVSLQEVADKVGIHKSSIFHYFKNKQEVLLCILEAGFDPVYESLEDISHDNNMESAEKLKKAIDNHLTFVSDYPAHTNIFLNEFRYLSKKKQRMKLLSKIKKYEKVFENIIEEMKREGHFHGADTKVVTFGILGMLNWLNRWFSTGGSLTIKDISNMFYLMIIKK